MKRLTAVAALVCVGLAMTGCDKKSTADVRIEALDKVYKQGKEARASMERRGVEVTDASCAEMFVSTNTDAEGTYDEQRDKQFQAARKVSYVNGCMNRPADATPAPSGSEPSSSAPSISPTAAMAPAS
ncbi:hypothetical protein KBX71_18600 [Micromonospora sp. D93]|uniref:hypothetical protein n=1 Tax=Micromonospora sp. D93 TaxID=2824886 RepID=UPI001B398D1C|nr:hypothetical protein [Micromonospora sp. D93]MBQ1019859.1 hypothetical protein [Micromonospora sp. D93]